MGLSAQEMVEVGEMFNDAVMMAFDGQAAGNIEMLLNYIYTMQKKEVPTTLFSGKLAGTKRLLDLVFNDPAKRDFIMLISFQFYSKFGQTAERYPELVENLAEGIGFVKKPDTNKDPSLVMAGEEYLNDMPSIEDVKDILTDNRWATIIALMMLYLMPMNGFAEIYKEKQEREAALARAAAVEAAKEARREAARVAAGEK